MTLIQNKNIYNITIIKKWPDVEARQLGEVRGQLETVETERGNGKWKMETVKS